MRVVLVVVELGVALGALGLGLRGALDGGILSRLLGVLEGLGGAHLLAGAPGGASVTGDLRRGSEDGGGRRCGAVRLSRRRLRGLLGGGLGLFDGALTPAGHAAHRCDGLGLRRLYRDRRR